MRELFSRRNRDRSQDPEVYSYLDFPAEFRNQCFHIISDIVNAGESAYGGFSYTETLCSSFAREKGLKYLPGNYGYVNNLDAIQNYCDKSANEDFLDLIDYIFGMLSENKLIYCIDYNYRECLNSGIKELNHRFRQHSLGYEFINGEIIQKTNVVTHERIIKPALRMLTDERFQGAEDEYLTAFKHLREGNNKDAILNAEKAFESTMKVICTELKYPFDPQKDTAKNLVQILKRNNYFPKYLESYMNNICTVLGEGASVIRNKESGHGQGETVKSTTDEYVEYVLNTVASNIVFLYRLFRSKEGAV